MLTEDIIIGKIEVLANGIIQVREDTIMRRDGKEVAKTYHRYTFSPGDDVSKADYRIKAISEIIWTTEIVDEFERIKARSIFPGTI